MAAKGQSPDDLVDTALARNGGQRAARFNTAIAKLESAKRSALPNPRLGFGYFLLPVETRVGPQRFKASISQSLPWFGTLKQRREQATWEAEAVSYRVDAQASDLALAVRTEWYMLWQLRQYAAIQEDELRLLEGFLSHVTRRYEVGEASLVDVLRIRLRLAEAQTELANLEAEYPARLAVLNALLGRPFDHSLNLPDSLPLPAGTNGEDLVGWQLHPDLKALAAEHKAAGVEAVLARKEGAPVLSIGLEYANIQPRIVDDLPENGQDVVAPVVSLSLPLQRRAYRAARDQANLRQRSLEAYSRDRSRHLDAAWAQAQFKWQKALNELLLSQQQVNEWQSALDILFTAYASGTADFDEVLRIEEQQLNARLRSISAMANLWMIKAEMQNLLEH